MAAAGKSRKSTAKNVVAPVEEDVYIIERIVDYREDVDGPKWRIRWKNYTAADDTWEPAENIMADDKKLQNEMHLLQTEFREAQNKSSATTPRNASSPKKRMASRGRAEPAPTKAKTRTSDLKTASNDAHNSASSQAAAKPIDDHSRQTDSSRGRLPESTKAERKPEPAKIAKSHTRTKVLHIRRFPDRDDDFQCVLANSDGETEVMPVSEARKIYYNELIDYLLKRVKFLETANN